MASKVLLVRLSPTYRCCRAPAEREKKKPYHPNCPRQLLSDRSLRKRTAHLMISDAEAKPKEAQTALAKKIFLGVNFFVETSRMEPFVAVYLIVFKGWNEVGGRRWGTSNEAVGGG